MSLTKKERQAAIKCAKKYPPGHGESFFSHKESVGYHIGESLCQDEKNLKYG